MEITNEDLKRFNKTQLNDICFNENYNKSKGYCSMDIWRALNHVRVKHFGMFSKDKKLTRNILKDYPSEVTLV